MTVNHWRYRKTGPCFPILVLDCKLHGHAFTVYPLGYVPYGEVAVAPVNAEGEPLFAAPSSDTSSKEHERAGLAWENTMFAAAVDAANGKPWRRDESLAEATCAPTWSTQQEWIATEGRVLGLAPHPPARVGEVISLQLELPRLVHLDKARDFQRERSSRKRGCIIVSILEALPHDRRILDRILACGALSEVWRPICRWDRKGIVHRFPSPGTGFG